MTTRSVRTTWARPLLATLATAVLLTGSGWPAAGAFEASTPDPLRRDARLVVQDIAAKYGVVGIGWRQGGRPGKLMVAFSKDGGESFLKNNGNLRKFNTLGLPARGLSLDICGRRGDRSIWIATAVRQGGDAAGDADVLLTRRSLRSPIKDAHQAFLTAPSQRRSVRSVDVACVGNRYLAIAWLEKTTAKTRARVMIRDQASFGTSRRAVSKIFNLGKARFKGGITVAANAHAIHVAWTRGDRRHLRYRRFVVEGEAQPSVSPRPAVRLARADIERPQLATDGQKVVIAYADAGRVKTKLSLDLGASFGPVTRLIRSGSTRRPSKVHSASLIGRSIVVEATSRDGSAQVGVPQRWRSDDLGLTWSSESFGHDGVRVGALLRGPTRTPLLTEAWHHDGPRRDTLRVQTER